jgi:c-di-GMP-binding flagellar brake protein YcgR
LQLQAGKVTLLESQGVFRSRHVEGENVNLNDNAQADRRHSDRFPIEREVRYRVLNKRSSEETGEGKTVNISSSGVLFTVGHMLLPGRRMELAISWPAQLNNKCALKLVARGRVVRFEGGRAAIEIQQYEFRTQSASPPVGPAGPRVVN